MRPAGAAPPLELQLGHLCNNRCVFCVSGQQTARGLATPAPAAPALAQLREARQQGVRQVTLLGGEPTLQPGFFEVLAGAAALGFDEIVVFTNGVKTARAAFVDQVIAAGAGRVHWRLSFQGATREAHDRTTGKPGSFDRLRATLGHLHERRQPISVNLCVVQSNADSLPALAALLVPFGVRQVHLDMMRPLDAGERSDDELASSLPRYPDLAAPLAATTGAFPPGFDVNVGNLPHCAAPGVWPFIHHDGEPTTMLVANGDRKPARPLDKYLTKRRDKRHLPGCSRCAFAPRCSGVFETYLRLYGDSGFTPVDLAALDRIDPDRQLLAPRWRLSLLGWSPPAPWQMAALDERGDRELHVRLEAGHDARLTVALRPAGPGVASTDRTSLHVLDASGPPALLAPALAALWAQVSAGDEVRHPLGDDALTPPVASVRARLGRLRERAPFASLRWTALRLSDHGTRATLSLVGPGGEQATLWLAEIDGRRRGGYQLAAAPSDALIEGLRAAMSALGHSA